MTTLALLSIVVASAAVFGWFSSRVLRLPITIGTMLLTVLSSVLLTFLAARLPDLHQGAVIVAARINFGDLILHGMLGLLLFAGAFLLDLEALAKEKLAVGVLAVVGTLLSTAAMASLMHWVLPLVGIAAPWIPCLLFGTLISPTDPIAVLELLQRVGVSRSVEAQLAGESLFNDGVAAVLFLTVLDASYGKAPSIAHIGGNLVLQAGGGLLLGVALAWITSHLMSWVEEFQVEILLTLALALGGYAVAEALHVSAPLEAVAAGLGLRHFNLRYSQKVISNDRLGHFWRAIDGVQNSLLFVLMGMEVLVIPFSRYTLESGALAVVGVLAVRTAVIAMLLALLRWMMPDHEASVFTLSWGGLRGGLSIALALSVPEGKGHDWIVATTYFVVVFAIVVQGGTLDYFLKRRQAKAAAAGGPMAAPLG